MIEPSNTELAELPEASFNYIESLEGENAELKARVARLEKVLILVYPSLQQSKARDMQVIIEAREILNESHAQSLAEIQSDAVEFYLKEQLKSRRFSNSLCSSTKEGE